MGSLIQNTTIDIWKISIHPIPTSKHMHILFYMILSVYISLSLSLSLSLSHTPHTHTHTHRHSNKILRWCLKPLTWWSHRKFPTHGYRNTWGPKGFSRSDHPLTIMVIKNIKLIVDPPCQKLLEGGMPQCFHSQ